MSLKITFLYKQKLIRHAERENKAQSEETKHASKPDSYSRGFRISNGLKKGYGKYAKGSNGKSEHVRTNG